MRRTSKIWCLQSAEFSKDRTLAKLRAENVVTPFRVLTHMVGIAIFSITAFLQGPASVTSESVSIAIRGAVEPVPAHGKFVLAYEVDIFNRASRESTVTSLEVFNGDGLSLLRYDKSNLKHNGRQFAPRAKDLRLPLKGGARDDGDGTRPRRGRTADLHT